MIAAIVVDRLLVGGVRFVLDKIAAAVDAEMDDPARIKEELLELELRHELGEVSDEERDVEEARLLRALRDADATRGGPISFDAADRPDIEVSFDGSAED